MFKVWIWYNKWKSGKFANFLWDAQKWCHLLLIAAVGATWAAALIASLALYLDLYVVEGNLQDTDGMKVHESMPWEHSQGITTHDLFSSPAIDLQILAWVIGPFWRLNTATALLVAWGLPASKCVEFSWHEVANAEDTKLKIIEETGMHC